MLAGTYRCRGQLGYLCPIRTGLYTSSSPPGLLITNASEGSSIHLPTLDRASARCHSWIREPRVRVFGLCAAWWGSNVVFNIVNKMTLKAFNMPFTVSSFQLLVTVVFMGTLWITRAHPFPKLSQRFLLLLLPLAFFHTIGHVAACVSVSRMALSFVHTVKSSEPVFVVALCGPLLGAVYGPRVWLAVLMIVTGCTLSAAQEVTMDWLGLNTAMASNAGMVLRGVYSNQVLAESDDGTEGVDGINLFGLISVVSLLFCIPATILLEGSQWRAAAAGAASVLGRGPTELHRCLLAGGALYALYNFFSYQVLNQGIGPVTFSIYNTMKRAAVIVAAVLVFRHPMSLLNWAGSALAILGTIVYTVARLEREAAV